MTGYVEFEFNLPDALLQDLVNVFQGVEGASLTLKNLAEVPNFQGVYQLFLGERLVYIGKTDAESGLRKRLERHASSILHRHNLQASDVKFKAVRVFVFTAIDLETQLLKYHGGVRNVEWNGSGFGANDPGRQRDHTNVKAESFDAVYPIDIDIVNDFNPTSNTAASMLSEVKRSVPYVFRFQNDEELRNTKIDDLPPLKISAREVISLVVSKLSPGWQATKLPGRVIIYREKSEYKHGEIIAKS